MKMNDENAHLISPINKRLETVEQARVFQVHRTLFQLDSNLLGPFATLANAPSPKALPRSFSRSSGEDATSRLPFTEVMQNKELLLPSAFLKQEKQATAPYEWDYSSDFIGAYSVAERRKRIERYRKKRKELNFRQVRYFTRANICQKRERVGGRFVKTAEVIRADKTAREKDKSPKFTRQKISANCQADQMRLDTDVSLIAETMLRMSRHTGETY